MSTRSSIVSFRLDDKRYLHFFYDVDGVHLTVESAPYEYEQDIHLTDEQWKEVKRQMVKMKELDFIDIAEVDKHSPM